MCLYTVSVYTQFNDLTIYYVRNGQKCAWLSVLWHPKEKRVLDTSLESLLSAVFGTSGITFQKRSGKFLFDLEARYPQYGK